jgi:hypothetical protein
VFVLYRVYWAEEEEIKKGFAKGFKGARDEMNRRLQEGFAAWMVPVAEADLDDDDIPF